MLNKTEAPAIQHAVKLIYDMSEDAMIKEMVRIRERAMHDEASFLATARNEGKAEGISIGEAKGRAEGRSEERNAIIEKMRKRGMTEEEIKEFFSN